MFDRELILSATKKSWKLASTHGTVYSREYRRRYKSIWDSVWERDNYTCYYCGFRALEFQEIHHLDSDHKNNSKDNLVTVCPLCHYAHHLDIAALSGGASMIWLPDYTQIELNHIARLIMVGREFENMCNKRNKEVPDFIKMLKTIENSFLDRKSFLEKYYEGATDPALFSNILINMTPEKYQSRGKSLTAFKLFLTNTSFPRQVQYWLKNNYAKIPPSEWLKLSKEQMDK